MTVHVAVGVVFNHCGEVLVSRRHEHVHLGGMWEFPGGKLEHGETIKQALCRELSEETTLQVVECEPLITVEHDYSDKSVVLHVLKVSVYSGVACGNEKQAIKWVRPEEMLYSEFPAADRKIISALILPACIAISGDYSSKENFLDRLNTVLQKPAGIFQLRVPELLKKSFPLPFVNNVIEKCHSSGVQVVLNSDQNLLAQTNADGVHLNSRFLANAHRREISNNKLLSASCHSVAELEKAETIGADYALLSAVFPTNSHPQATSLGWEQFAYMVRQVNIPVYALGGVSPSHIEKVREHGGQGIAAISALWK